MYSKIIVPLDGSELAEQALPYAKLIAKSLSVPIELVRAFDIPSSLMLRARSQLMADRILAGVRNQAESYLSGIRLRLEAEGYSVSTAAIRSSPAEAIAAHASTDASALVAMSTHGRGGISRWVMGSVTDRALHSVANPMLIVRAAESGQAVPADSLQSILAPLDGSPLAELSLPHAASIAAALSARITLLRVTPTVEHYRHEMVSAASDMAGAADFDLASAEQMAEADTEQVAAYLADAANRLAGEHTADVSLEHQRSHNVAQAIIDQAAAEPSLVVMSSHGRSGLGRMVLGSVTDRVVRHSNAPILVVR